MSLGSRILQARTACGMSQRALAGDQITRNMLSQLEHDQSLPSLSTLQYLAGKLGVSVSWLLEESAGEREDLLLPARSLFRSGDPAGCLQFLQEQEAAGEEAVLLKILCAEQLARRAMEQEQTTQARELAGTVLELAAGCLYPTRQQVVSAWDILARLGEEAEEASYRKAYLQRPQSVRYHLTMARLQLQREHIQAAEKEIWSIADLPEEDRAEYLILRGRIALKKEQFENAELYLRQAEGAGTLPKILLRELYEAMEICCRETEDYKNAYLYTAKQREL
mgnify:CR=1 FL=1